LRALESRATIRRIGGKQRQMTLAEIEQAKHAASWLNSLATNLATTGAIAPLIAYIAGTPASLGRFELLALAVICFLLALILHKIGSDILAGIRV
jgi:uncharacterized membrane protein